MVALLQNNGTQDGGSRALQAQKQQRPPQRRAAYVTLKFDDNGHCRIHSICDGDKEIVTNERYVVMPWKAVNMDGKSRSLKEAVDEIFSNQDELTPPT